MTRTALARQQQQQQQQQQRHVFRSSVVASAQRGGETSNHNTPAFAASAAVALATSAAAAALLLAAPAPAFASDSTTTPTTTVYFGNGCFWGRQKDFVETELKTLKRNPERVSAVSGYAAGTSSGPENKVCYHFNDPRQVYERLGHAEVVAVELDGALSDDDSNSAKAQDEMRKFSKTYFSQFRRLRDGRLQRLDPQDAGPGYRNVVGLPGGVQSPLFEVLKSEAPQGIQLREGQGRKAEIGGAAEASSSASGADEGDEIGVVWVVDSSKLPFYRAEQYHQYHRGLEGSFPASYLKGQRDVALKAGRIDPTGCLEFPF
jgi:peptide methionine sulfoxide reductase MsrA